MSEFFLFPSCSGRMRSLGRDIKRLRVRLLLHEENGMTEIGVGKKHRRRRNEILTHGKTKGLPAHLRSARYRYHDYLQLKVSVVRVLTPVSVSAKYSRGTEWNHIFAAGESVVPILVHTVPGQSFTAFVYASQMNRNPFCEFILELFCWKTFHLILKSLWPEFSPWLTYCSWASYGVSKRARNNSSSDRGTLHYI